VGLRLGLTGFPKSLDVSKAIDKAAGKERETISKVRAGFGKRNGVKDSDGGIFLHSLPEELKQINITAPATDAAKQWAGWGTALKPAYEPIIMARKPLDGTVAANVQKWGCGAINIDGCRVPANGDMVNARKDKGNIQDKGRTSQVLSTPQGTPWDGTQGRWPANLIHDGSDEVLELFPSPHGAGSKYDGGKWGNKSNAMFPLQSGARFGDSGSAARFFYCAKASRAEREIGCEGMEETLRKTMSGGDCRSEGRTAKHGHSTMSNVHPCVKPLALMRYLCRLVTPPNGIILDPFMGSGTTGMAAKIEGFRFIGIEKEQEYVDIAERRIEATA
jgi:site-specific DNA-methyltransferase (adenine-specific)